MKREIKFRAKAINDGYYKGEWVYGYYTKILQGGELVDVMTDGAHEVPIQIDTLGQYTGLKDKEGRGVYEGDIFKDSNGVLRSIFRVPGGLAFEDNPVAFGYDHRAPVYPYSPLAESQNEAWISQCCEVIGNIHDNPEWVKTKQK